MKLIEPISAIVSWEDYDYQGHIALYYSLKLIQDAIMSKTRISDLVLQIESIEDFAICKDNQYISLHQVKAGKIALKDNDKFSFLIEILENNAGKGVFHITNGKNVPCDIVSTTKSYIETLKEQLQKPLIEKEKLTFGDNEANYIVVENIPGNHKKADVYSIIKYVLDGRKSITSIENVISDIQRELLKHEETIDNRVKDARMLNPQISEDSLFVSVYPERFDNAVEIRKAAYLIIKKIIEEVQPSFRIFADENYTKLVYDQVFLLMKQRITDFYISKTKTGRCQIAFDEMLSIIKTDFHEKITTVGYQYFLTLCAIRDNFDRYPLNNGCENICSECDLSDSCNLLTQINKLNKCNENEKCQIIHNLLLRTPQVGKPNNLPSDDLIEDLLLNVLHEIDIMGLNEENVFVAMKNGNQTYRLTLDESRKIESFLNILQNEIKISESKSLLYECDVLITDRLNQKNVIVNGDNIRVLSSKELEEISDISSSSLEDIMNDCNKPKVIQLINKEQAIGELK